MIQNPKVISVQNEVISVVSEHKADLKFRQFKTLIFVTVVQITGNCDIKNKIFDNFTSLLIKNGNLYNQMFSY